ncbi:MAG: SH3 domain-containing protein [Treponema sp.]
MEREKRNWKSRKYIRLLMILLSSYGLFANPSLINIEYFPKTAHILDVFTIKFYMDSRLNSIPKIVLNDYEALELETSNVFIEHGNTVIENQYKINKTGLIKLSHILLYIENQIIEVPPIELDVQANPLSKDTQFRTRILKYTGSKDIDKSIFYEYDAKLQFILGEQYFVLIEGLFEKTTEQKIHIQYDLPDNAFIEKLKTYPIEFQQDEIWQPIAMFLWIPLKKGMQALPFFNLTLDISKTQEYKLVLEKLTVDVVVNEKKEIEKDVAKEVFHDSLNKALKEEHSSKQYSEKELEIARQIKDLREKEYASFFYADLQKMREELEKELGLENTFTVFHYKLYIMSIVIATLFLSYSIYRKFAKKMSFNFYSVLSFCVGIFILFYGIKTNDLRKEYTFTNVENNCNIYISPEINSTIIENVSIGETVKILYTSSDWFLVETRKNIRGWMQK